MCIIDPLKHYIDCKSIIHYLRRYWVLLFYCLLIMVYCQSCSSSGQILGQPKGTPTPLGEPITPNTTSLIEDSGVLTPIVNTPTPSGVPTDPNAPPPVEGPGLLANQFSRPAVRIVEITQSKEQFVSTFDIEADNSITNKVQVLDYINNDELGDKIVAGAEIMIPPPDFCKVELLQTCQISIDSRLSQQQLLIVTTNDALLDAIANKLHISQESLIEYNPSLAGHEIVSAYTVFQVPGTITRTTTDE